MKRLAASIGWLSASVAFSVAPAAVARPARLSPSCCQVAAGTVVEVELVDPVSTKVQKSGDRFAFRLAAPLIVKGRIVLRAGTPGVGEVIEAAKPGMGGKPAELVLAARYLAPRSTRVPLQGLQMAAAGSDHSMAAQAVGLTGLAFAPLGFVSLAVKGGDVTFPAGATAAAKVASDMFLPSLGLASRRAVAAAAAAHSAAEAAQTDVRGSIEVGPSPPGEGQVVFFRNKSLLGTGQWFNVREDGAALGKLTNGAYFIRSTSPGLHTFTATEEPEFKDHLKIEVDAGETYFIEGTLTKGVVIGAADLSPSNRAAFDEHSNELKLARAPDEAAGADPSDHKPQDANGAIEPSSAAGPASSAELDSGGQSGDPRNQSTPQP